jgi:hypothetical protein
VYFGKIEGKMENRLKWDDIKREREPENIGATGNTEAENTGNTEAENTGNTEADKMWTAS